MDLLGKVIKITFKDNFKLLYVSVFEDDIVNGIVNIETVNQWIKNKIEITVYSETIILNREFELEECNVCGGSGFSGYGSGYDAVCDNCGGKGELPKY